MGKSQDYITNAEEAERIAAEMKEPHKQHWLALARGWRDMAAQAAGLPNRKDRPS
jgi:hypothetical protein